jgi:dephospho-CoA kinase
MSREAGPRRAALVLVGMPGSGKSTLAAFLRRHDWPVVRFGDITMEELQKKGLPIQEGNERAIREGLRREHGMAAFAKLSIPAIGAALDGAHRVVIDGLYSWAEIKHLRERLRAEILIVATYTPKRDRYRRLGTRDVRPLTPAEAESRDVAEIENLEKGGPIAFADHTLLNTGSIKDLERGLEDVLRAEGLWGP